MLLKYFLLLLMETQIITSFSLFIIQSGTCLHVKFLLLLYILVTFAKSWKPDFLIIHFAATSELITLHI